jgi:predicted ArsR family transcriptional regulator
VTNLNQGHLVLNQIKAAKRIGATLSDLVLATRLSEHCVRAHALRLVAEGVVVRAYASTGKRGRPPSVFMLRKYAPQV